MTAAAAAAKGTQPLVADEATAAALALVVAGGLVEGVALGTAQAAGLRRWLPRLRRSRWVAVTVAVAGIGWAAASAPAVLAADDGTGAGPPVWLVLAGAAALGATMGTVLGAAQAVVLRGHVRHPWRWVGANAAAWTPAMAVIFLGATSPAPDWPVLGVVGLGTLTGAMAGAILGVISGWFLASLDGARARHRAGYPSLGRPAR